MRGYRGREVFYVHDLSPLPRRSGVYHREEGTDPWGKLSIFWLRLDAPLKGGYRKGLLKSHPQFWVPESRVKRIPPDPVAKGSLSEKNS